MKNRLLGALLATLPLLATCGGSPRGRELTRAADLLEDARAAGLARDAVLEAGRRGLRIEDVLHRGFPAGPPGRLRFRIDVTKQARLRVACAIDPR
jgi:hypothetical protein